MRFKHSRRARFETLETRNMMAVLPGDYNLSGVVDTADYTVWKSEFGVAGDSPADGNNDFVVDAADYTVWRDNLGKTLSDVPPDSPQSVTATPTGPTSVEINWQAVPGASSYTVQRRQPDIPGDPFVDVGTNILANTFVDTMVAAGTVYAYQLIAQNTAGTSQPSQATTVTAGRANITAFRPQQLHEFDDPATPIYFPFARTPVAEQDEESLTLGPGIRVNRDDDNNNEIVDRFESGFPIVEENDLIEVQIDRLPGQGDLVLEVGFDLQVYYTYDKEQPVPFDNEGVFTEPLPFVNDMATVFVEWVANGHGTDFVRLVDPMTMAVIDTLMFHSFTSLTMVLGGLNQVPSVPTDPNHGVFQIADRLYAQGFDVMKWDEEDVRAENEAGEPGDGAVYFEIRHAVNERLVEDISILGYSQGGGSTYNLSHYLDDQNFFGDIGPYNLVFTAYIDGINDNTLAAQAEQRLPVNTQWHLNLFQDADFFDPLLLDGDPVPGANENFNVETSPLFDLPDITHFDIDDNLEVQDWVLMRYLENVDR